MHRADVRKRKKKSSDQKDYLMKLLEDNHGEMPEKEVRDLAAEKTGLTEYKVYQWLYKKILRMKEDYKNKNGISKGQTKIFIVKR
jgi:hypothetical protein